MRCLSGEIDDIATEMRIEVKRARGFPWRVRERRWHTAASAVLRQAQKHLEAHGLAAAVQERASRPRKNASESCHTDM
jgi:hypothetical protein